MPKTECSSTLRHELEQNIRGGRCAYCRMPAAEDRPLTREHVIPRAKGGRRNDVRIIVPACARCNHRRGCQELARFLLLRPRRISAFLDYLCSLSPASVQQMDLRVYAEVYAAVWMLSECSLRGQQWRAQLKRLCGGRTLHRRRYAARRMVRAVGGRLQSRRGRSVAEVVAGPVPLAEAAVLRTHLDEPLEQLCARLLGLLSLAWRVSAEEVRLEMARQLDRDAVPEEAPESAEEPEGAVLALDGWKRNVRRRRLRVDRRRGRGSGSLRGRAA